MRGTLLLCVVGLLLPGAGGSVEADGPAAAIKKRFAKVDEQYTPEELAPFQTMFKTVDELTRLEGRWRVVRSEFQGKPIDTKKPGQLLEFRGSCVSVVDVQGRKFIDSTVVVDTTVKPHLLLIIPQEPPFNVGFAGPGIYKIEGDTLTWASGRPPLKFDSEERVLVVMERVTD